MLSIGFDIGSSFVKAALYDASKGKVVATAQYPETEMDIVSLKPGWAEQHPEMWWENVKRVLQKLLNQSNVNPKDIESIGITYQMHGLVLIDKDHKVLRPSIIWCDSRAGETGEKAFNDLGKDKCLGHLLNSPGNFTASKLKWVKDNEPDIYEKVYKFMLPGDYIAMKMTGEVNSSVTGLSEGILWDFKEHSTAIFLLDYFGIDRSLVPMSVPVFAVQGLLLDTAAKELGLSPGIAISYRAGDQPNNAFSLNVLYPGEVAASAGTSGVLYAVSDQAVAEPLSRVNTFAHVNHLCDNPRLGILLCVNGTGSLNAWMKNNIAGKPADYDEMNIAASEVEIGAEGLLVYPFGNGSERVLMNRNPGAGLLNLNFNIHNKKHLYRAGQEGVACAFRYGLDLMEYADVKPEVIRAANTGMFKSPVFREAISGLTGATIELYETDGAVGAAQGAAFGYGYFSSAREIFLNFTPILAETTDGKKIEKYKELYERWKENLR
jgi:xylulokinase